MYKFGFNFLQLYIQFAPCTGQSRIVPGQSGFNKKRQIYNKFYFLISKLIHRHQCYLYKCLLQTRSPYMITRNIKNDMVYT